MLVNRPDQPRRNLLPIGFNQLYQSRGKHGSPSVVQAPVGFPHPVVCVKSPGVSTSIIANTSLLSTIRGVLRHLDVEIIVQ